MIVAVVNDYEISFDEFKAELKQVLNKMHLQQPNKESKAKAIEQLINAYLLMEEAKKSGFEIPAEEVENGVIDYMLQFGSEEDFNNSLRNCNLNLAALRNKIRNELLIEKYVSVNFPKNQDFSFDELEEIYNQNQDSFATQLMIKASHILIKRTDNEGLQKAMQIRKSIGCTDDFLKYAKECSECPSCCDSGNLGYFTRGKMVKEFEDIAFQLEINEISAPVKTPFGYHLIMVTDKKESYTARFEEVKEILKQRLQQIESDLKLIKHIKKLRMLADVSIFEEVFSML